jgi:hypothetical protein
VASVDTFLEKYLRELQEIRSSGETIRRVAHSSPVLA